MRSGKRVTAEVGGSTALINQSLVCAGASAVASTSLRHSRSWYEITKPFARANHRRAVTQLFNTGLPFLLLVAGLIYGQRNHPLLTLLLVPPAVFLQVRLFIIQHDCGHGSFFASRKANDFLGRALGVLTLTPYVFWRTSHAIHHANSGKLDRRGVGDVTLMTVGEYRALSRSQRLLYQAYRHPIVLFGVAPFYLFILRNRIPTVGLFGHGKVWGSIFGTNLALAVIVVLMLLTVGAHAFVLAYLPVVLLAASVGVWLFYIQHQFERAYWATRPDWDFHAAALQGSSFYDLPVVLHWLTGFIGFHHIHHLCSKIPNYNLRDCFDQTPELRCIRHLTFRESLGCFWLTLWDEERQRLVSFRDIRSRKLAPT